ncbi:MAG: peptidoglycan recognition family protein [Verrucomicrobiota bacterium]
MARSVTLRAVVRFRLCLATAVALSAILGTVLVAQIKDDEKAKREEFLKARSAEPDESPSATPKRKGTKKKSATKKKAEDESTPAPKEKTSPTPKPKSKKKKTKTAEKESSESKSKAKKKAAKPEKTPIPKETGSARASATPIERPTAPLPRAIPLATPEERPQVVIEKSGFDGRQELVPPPSPPPRRFLFWPSRSQSSTSSYRYLSRSVVEEIRRAPVQRRRWQFIVVHNSGTRQGNAKVFDYYHKHVRRMQNGLAYHFVIGNGTSTGNGQVEIGDRWRRQINGGHVHSDYLNNISLGICLVGDFNRDQPTRAQLECCEELIRFLRQRCGQVDGHDVIVRPHREMNPPRWSTDCPGDRFPYSWFGRFR